MYSPSIWNILFFFSIFNVGVASVHSITYNTENEKKRLFSQIDPFHNTPQHGLFLQKSNIHVLIVSVERLLEVDRVSGTTWLKIYGWHYDDKT